MTKQKFEKRVTGGMSVYYGMGMLLVGVVATIGAMVIAVKIFIGSSVWLGNNSGYRCHWSCYGHARIPVASVGL